MNLTDAIFHDDEAARLHLEAQRWPNGLLKGFEMGPRLNSA